MAGGKSEGGKSKVIQLADHARRREKIARGRIDDEARTLIKISNEIDAIVLRHLEAGDVEPRDLAGLLSHRLGTLIRHLEGKEKLWDVCEKVLKKQAAID
ncbi:MAG: hypothetical protein RIQ81_680 [Pseudomonadota bacterium]|jgi:hypothetical protein